jgi:dTDP-4-dehydrorhamnose 3,5-epimerase
MKILDVKTLAIPDVKVVRYGRFKDQRGYFTEPYRASDLHRNPITDFLKEVAFLQENESYSVAGVIRGMHFQWNPCMGKFVRTIRGRMVDLVLDIRKGSPTLGRMIAYEIPDAVDAGHAEWIWVPPGFAHGNFFTAETTIEYFCTAEYNPACEAGISPLAPDIDWSLCDPAFKAEFDAVVAAGPVMSDKDRNAMPLQAWLADERSENFVY